MRTEPAPPAGPRLAVIDGASFVLPYDHGLVSGLAQRGWRVTLFASRTRYNGEFLDALQREPNVEVKIFDISGTVAPRWRGVWQYLQLWAEVWRRRDEFDAVNLQFSIVWPLEWLLAWALGRRFVFTLHNATPHGFDGVRHRPTAALLARAHRVLCPSRATLAEVLQRYGPLPRAMALPLGLMPVAPGDTPRPYGPMPAPQALVFWGNVMPYKGVDLLLALAQDPAWRVRGLPLEVHGTFAPELRRLRDQLQAAGVTVVDRFLSADEQRALFARPVVFVMPYTRATQSGALYTLLRQGCRMLCTDTGDLGDFCRRHSLDHLLLDERSPAALIAALDRLLQTSDAAAFNAAQQACAWAQTLADADQAYGLRKSSPC